MKVDQVIGEFPLNKKKVLIASPVCQKAEILKHFLTSIKRQVQETISIDYIFVDDNSDVESSLLLKEFSRDGSIVTILKATNDGEYLCDEHTHHWTKNLILRVANHKNRMIDHAIQHNYDYIFLIDSDIIITTSLVEFLKSKNKEIITEIFWSNWTPESSPRPNAWLFDEYDLVPKKYGEQLTENEKAVQEEGFLNQLRVPGTYQVGGVCACTLIKRAALLKGVNFKPISNLTIWGEDRFLCIRAAVHDIAMYIDTHYPIYHIYRESDLDGVDDYIKLCNKQDSFKRNPKGKNNRITVSMIVRNEEHRYLRRVLESIKNHIDEAVILDDCSTDATAALCEEILSGIPLTLIRNTEPLFGNESQLREKLWEETIRTNPDWILSIDADEIIEQTFWERSDKLMNQTDYDKIDLRLHDMWSETHYREDPYWDAHRHYKTFFIRYYPNFTYMWNQIPQHCGRFPMNLFSFQTLKTDYRVKHMGWASPKDRKAKYERYQKLDPSGIYGEMKQYESILEKHPTLIPWEGCVEHE